MAFVCGDPLIDPRDNQSYPTLLMGTQCWMGAHINIGIRVDSELGQAPHSNMKNDNIIEKYCYKNDPANCLIFGGLYEWSEAMQYSVVDGAQGICPPGWHLPSDAEFHTMVNFVNSDAPKTHQQDLPTNADIAGETLGTQLKVGGSSGFDWPISRRRRMEGDWWGAPIGYLWTSTQFKDPAYAYLYEVFESKTIVAHPYHEILFGFSVRCMQD